MKRQWPHKKLLVATNKRNRLQKPQKLKAWLFLKTEQALKVSEIKKNN